MRTAPDADHADLWQRAASFAARAHRHQTRRDGATPYVAHVFRVAMTVRDVFACDDPICIAAALLHDTIEDTGADYDEIAEDFGHDVATCVAALTKNMALPEAEREAEYDARLASADWRARLVKLADQYDNLCDLCTDDPAFCARAIARAGRAVKLAELDKGNPTVARAAAIVQAKTTESGQ
jgi:guanosine-3',5'-bis(diphosphate) 3'-pyrophosphohydrolase